jgi:hypothetical protein
MEIQTRRIVGVMLGAFILASAQAQPPGDLHFTTNCVVFEMDSVEGYVTNQSQDTYQVNGQVRFVFLAHDSISRPAIVTPANSMVPPGETVRVTSIKLTFRPQAGESCRFEVADVLSKL